MSPWNEDVNENRFRRMQREEKERLQKMMDDDEGQRIIKELSIPKENIIPQDKPISINDYLGKAAPPADPWAHRSDGMRCKTCMWFVPKPASAKLGGVTDLGRCRRHAPTMTGYPAVFVNDFCGDHKLDENKV